MCVSADVGPTAGQGPSRPNPREGDSPGTSLLAQLLHSNLGRFTSNYDWHLLSPSDHQRSFIIRLNQEAMSGLKSFPEGAAACDSPLT